MKKYVLKADKLEALNLEIINVYQIQEWFTLTNRFVKTKQKKTMTLVSNNIYTSSNYFMVEVKPL